MSPTTKSPCIGVCQYEDWNEKDIERICKGCSRTAEEIEEWFLATEERRAEIVYTSSQRKLEKEYKKDLTSIQRIFMMQK